MSADHTPVLSLAEAVALDAAMAAWKAPLPGNPFLSAQEQHRQDRALQLQIQSQSRFSNLFGD